MKRWWGIRHVRWLWYDYQVYKHAAFWRSVGIGVGGPNESDLKILQMIWDGEF